MERDDFCFGCGTENPAGLRLRIETGADGTVWNDYTVPDHFQGYRGVVHGGILATLLDEVMAHAVLRAGSGSAATAQLEIRYRQPAPVGETLRTEARVERISGRRIQVTGRIRNREGQVVAEGQALFLRGATPTSR